MWYNIGLMGSEMVLWGIRLIFIKASLIQNLARCTILNISCFIFLGDSRIFASKYNMHSRLAQKDKH